MSCIDLDPVDLLRKLNMPWNAFWRHSVRWFVWRGASGHGYPARGQIGSEGPKFCTLWSIGGEESRSPPCAVLNNYLSFCSKFLEILSSILVKNIKQVSSLKLRSDNKFCHSVLDPGKDNKKLHVDWNVTRIVILFSVDMRYVARNRS